MTWRADYAQAGKRNPGTSRKLQLHENKKGRAGPNNKKTKNNILDKSNQDANFYRPLRRENFNDFS